MRFLLFVIVLSFSVFVSGKSLSKTLEGDSLLLKLQNNLPEGWLIRITDDTLVIENLTPMWVLNGNYINAPLSAYANNEENKNKIMEHGIKTHAQFSFYLVERVIETSAKKPKGKRKKVVLDDNSPNYLSQKFALYELIAIGCNGSFERHYPWDIQEQASKIYFTTIGHYLEKIKGPNYSSIVVGE